MSAGSWNVIQRFVMTIWQLSFRGDLFVLDQVQDGDGIYKQGGASSNFIGGCSTPRDQPACCGCGGRHTASYRGCVRWKEAKAALAKQAPQRSLKSVATALPAAPKAQRAGPSAEQRNLGEGWNHVVQGGPCRQGHGNPTQQTAT